jgi:hypothetical protein
MTPGEIALGKAAIGAAGSLLAGGKADDDYMRKQRKKVWGASGEYRKTGDVGAQGLRSLMQDPWSITSDPGYQFGLEQGFKGIQAMKTAGGLGLSGSTLKDLTMFGQDYGTKFLQQKFNMYKDMSDIGQKSLSDYMGMAAPAPRQGASAGIMGATSAITGGLRDYWTMSQPKPMYGQFPTRS